MPHICPEFPLCPFVHFTKDSLGTILCSTPYTGHCQGPTPRRWQGRSSPHQVSNQSSPDLGKRSPRGKKEPPESQENLRRDEGCHSSVSKRPTFPLMSFLCSRIRSRMPPCALSPCLFMVIVDVCILCYFLFLCNPFGDAPVSVKVGSSLLAVLGLLIG